MFGYVEQKLLGRSEKRLNLSDGSASTDPGGSNNAIATETIDKLQPDEPYSSQGIAQQTLA
jgi:hypothetical protein